MGARKGEIWRQGEDSKVTKKTEGDAGQMRRDN